MVFKHNKQPFADADDDYYQFAFKHLRQLDCDGHLASSAEFSFKGIPGKHLVSDGERGGSFSHSQRKVMLEGDANDVHSVILKEEVESWASNNSNHSAVSNISSLPCTTGSTGEVRLDHSKRPFSDSESCQFVFKRLRQVDQDSDMDSFEGISSFNSSAIGSGTSVTAVEEIASKPEGNASISISNLPWLTCNTIEEGTRSELPCRPPSFPCFFEDDHRASAISQSEGTCLPFFDYPPRKLVPIGQNHQADIPLWRPQCTEFSLAESGSLYSASDRQHMVEEDSGDKWMGTCVLPMPDSNSLAAEARVGTIKTECSCPDEGSIRCTRHHVREARERLKNMLGEDSFRDLGFCDMGEDVAHKWTEEEEQLFHEVLINNSFSLGKNFWNYLPRAFPDRSSKELVSYYFNVFMLRKRAHQNRSDPLDVDSDNDEWQECNDGEFATTEEDSVVESPIGHAFCYEGPEDDSDDCGIAGEEDEELYGASERCVGDRFECMPEVQTVKKNSQDGGEGRDAQDDSCTSYEGHYNKVDCFTNPFDFSEPQDSLVGHRQYRADDLSDTSYHKYMMGHCDPKTWDINCVPGTERDVEFLPTSNVIEEVFGKGAWENEASDNHGII